MAREGQGDPCWQREMMMKWISVQISDMSNYYEYSHSNETKTKKILKFKEFCFPPPLSLSLSRWIPVNYTKICNALSFPSFLSCFFCIKFLYKTLLSVLSFWIRNRTKKLLNLPFKITHRSLPKSVSLDILILAFSVFFII